MNVTYHRPRTGGEALQELRHKCEGVFLSWLAFRAGRNYFNLHPNVEDSFIHGAHAMRRWLIWLFFVKVWLFSACFTGWMLYLRFHDVRGESFQDHSGDMGKITRNGLIFLGPALIALVVTYNRNVDFSLFKRRFVYKVTRPLTVVLDKVPNFVLYLTVLCILCFPI